MSKIQHFCKFYFEDLQAFENPQILWAFLIKCVAHMISSCITSSDVRSRNLHLGMYIFYQNTPQEMSQSTPGAIQKIEKQSIVVSLNLSLCPWQLQVVAKVETCLHPLWVSNAGSPSCVSCSLVDRLTRNFTARGSIMALFWAKKPCFDRFRWYWADYVYHNTVLWKIV